MWICQEITQKRGQNLAERACTCKCILLFSLFMMKAQSWPWLFSQVLFQAASARLHRICQKRVQDLPKIHVLAGNTFLEQSSAWETWPVPPRTQINTFRIQNGKWDKGTAQPNLLLGNWKRWRHISRGAKRRLRYVLSKALNSQWEHLQNLYRNLLNEPFLSCDHDARNESLWPTTYLKPIRLPKLQWAKLCVLSEDGRLLPWSQSMFCLNRGWRDRWRLDTGGKNTATLILPWSDRLFAYLPKFAWSWLVNKFVCKFCQFADTHYKSTLSRMAYFCEDEVLIMIVFLSGKEYLWGDWTVPASCLRLSKIVAQWGPNWVDFCAQQSSTVPPTNLRFCSSIHSDQCQCKASMWFCAFARFSWYSHRAMPKCSTCDFVSFKGLLC